MRHDTRQTGRRQFIAMGAGAAAAAALGWHQAAADDVPKKPQPGAPKPEDVKLPAGAKMPMRKLGRTGVEVSLVGLGGFHIGLPKDEADGDRGSSAPPSITASPSWTTAGTTTTARATRWMGRALRDGYRQRVFLMTKIDGRTRKAAAEQIEQCLRALRDRRHRSGADPRGDPR